MTSFHPDRLFSHSTICHVSVAQFASRVHRAAEHLRHRSSPRRAGRVALTVVSVTPVAGLIVSVGAGCASLGFSMNVGSGAAAAPPAHQKPLSGTDGDSPDSGTAAGGSVGVPFPRPAAAPFLESLPPLAPPRLPGRSASSSDGSRTAAAGFVRSDGIRPGSICDGNPEGGAEGGGVGVRRALGYPPQGSQCCPQRMPAGGEGGGEEASGRRPPWP